MWLRERSTNAHRQGAATQVPSRRRPCARISSSSAAAHIAGAKADAALEAGRIPCSTDDFAAPVRALAGKQFGLPVFFHHFPTANKGI